MAWEKYDGYDPKADTLLEAKGLGYDQWFDKNLNAIFEFEGLDSLEILAKRQVRLAGGSHVRWQVKYTQPQP
jgi:restriction endonuclease fold toxin 5 of polymorphic toxin system